MLWYDTITIVADRTDSGFVFLFFRSVWTRLVLCLCVAPLSLRCAPLLSLHLFFFRRTTIWADLFSSFVLLIFVFSFVFFALTSHDLCVFSPSHDSVFLLWAPSSLVYILSSVSTCQLLLDLFSHTSILFLSRCRCHVDVDDLTLTICFLFPFSLPTFDDVFSSLSVSVSVSLSSRVSNLITTPTYSLLILL